MKFNERSYAFTDIETTGLDFRIHEIVEIGLVVVKPDTLDITKTFEAKVNLIGDLLMKLLKKPA